LKYEIRKKKQHRGYPKEQGRERNQLIKGGLHENPADLQHKPNARKNQLDAGEL
jgi:hypothetical protein